MVESDTCQGRQKGKKCFTGQDTQGYREEPRGGGQGEGNLRRQSNCEKVNRAGTGSAGA